MNPGMHRWLRPSRAQDCEGSNAEAHKPPRKGIGVAPQGNASAGKRPVPQGPLGEESPNVASRNRGWGRDTPAGCGKSGGLRVGRGTPPQVQGKTCASHGTPPPPHPEHLQSVTGTEGSGGGANGHGPRGNLHVSAAHRRRRPLRQRPDGDN